MLAVFRLIKVGHLCGHNATHNAVLHLNHRYLQSFAGGNRGNFKTNIAGPDNDQPCAFMHAVTYRSNVLNVSEVVHLSQIRPWQVQFPDSGTRSDDQIIVLVRILVRVAYRFPGGIDASDASSEAYVDIRVVIKRRRLYV